MIDLRGFLDDLRDDAEYAALRAGLTAAFVAASAKRRGRATHLTGVGGRGTVRVRPDLPLPAHEVWQPGRRFDLVLRHANLQLADDLAADFRGAALKLSDRDGHVVDLLLNTGPVTVWAHVAQFAERMQLAMRGQLAAFYERHPDALPRYWAGLRRAPDGYDTLAYYSKLSGVYQARDGARYACRYRLVPQGYPGRDTGQPTARDQEAGVDFTARWPEEAGPADRLRQAYRARVAAGGVAYTLAIAVREAPRDVRDPVYDATQAWDLAEHPWVALADVRVDAPIEPAELDRLRFSIAHAPDSLGVFPADSATDFTSLGDLRASLYAAAAIARPG